LIAYSITFFAFPNAQDEGKDGEDFPKLRVHETTIEAQHAPQRIIHLKDFPTFNSQYDKWGA
jgi:hypothetical protein